jgi:hypothetical protein
MNGYDLSSRSRMLKRGWYCLMKFCSASSASASLPTSTEVDRLGHLDHLHLAAGHAVGEVAGDPAADRLGLADVDDLARAVLEQVDARPVGRLLRWAFRASLAISRPEDMATIPTSDTVRDLARAPRSRGACARASSEAVQAAVAGATRSA